MKLVYLCNVKKREEKKKKKKNDTLIHDAKVETTMKIVSW